MCFPFGSCFGGRAKEDWGREQWTPKGNGHDGYHGNDHKAAQAATTYHQPVVDEAGRKAYYDAPRDGHGYTGAAHAHDRAYAPGEASKRAARNNKVGDHTGYTATNTTALVRY